MNFGQNLALLVGFRIRFRALRTAMAHNAPRDPAYLAHTEEGSLETSLVAAGAVDYAVVRPEPDRPSSFGGWLAARRAA